MADAYGDIRQKLSDYVLNEAGVQDLREMAATMAVRRLDKSFKAAEVQEAPEIREDGCVAVVAQMDGIFYRAAAHSSPLFVEVDSVVAKGDTVALIEAMKLYNEVLAPVAGTIVEICCENDVHVKSNDVLMWVRPSEEQPVVPD